MGTRREKTRQVARDVVERDKRLRNEQERAGTDLMLLRWTWTLDPDNNDRVGFATYARAVGVDRASIYRYAKAYVLINEHRGMSVHDALYGAGLSDDSLHEAIERATTERVALKTARRMINAEGRLRTPAGSVRSAERALERALENVGEFGPPDDSLLGSLKKIRSLASKIERALTAGANGKRAAAKRS